MKIYNKQGKHNYKESKLEKALSAHFELHPEQMEGYIAPKNFDELKAVHDKYCIEETEILSETINSEKPQTHQSFRDSMDPEKTTQEDNNLFTAAEDPMNRDNPKIRDYVLDDGFTEDKGKKAATASNFSEPTNFRESFDIPDDTIQSDKPKNGAGPQNNPYNSPPPPRKEGSGPDPDAKAKKKSRKKFTRHAVNAVCALAGKGIVWYATKDITDSELAKSIANDEISEASLRLLVFLNDGTQGEVKQFFRQCIGDAQNLAEFTPEEKDDLIEALDDFLDFKKIEINPGIELGAVFLGLMLDRALKALMIKASASSILVQLKDMHKNTYDASHRDPAAEAQEVQDPAGTTAATTEQENNTEA